MALFILLMTLDAPKELHIRYISLGEMARGPVAGRHFAQGRNFHLATGEFSDWTARMKRAAGGRGNRRGNVAGQDDAFALGVWIDFWNG